MDKFRVFMEGKMWYAEDFKKATHQFMMGMDGSVWVLRNVAYDLVEAHEMDVVVMFWTGLKDKDGKDIYDGDIVEFDADSWGTPDGRWAVMYNAKYGMWETGGGTNLECEVWKTVIGNIHEHPDLLE